MRNWLIYALFGTLAVVMGGHDLVTGTGSLVFGTRNTTVYGLPKVHYTGPAAAVEGLIFIGIGIFCLVRAWRLRADDEDGR